jgi:uncharacterized protein (DUF111 family)
VLKVEVGGLPMDVKWGKWRGSLVSVAPEYEDCARVASITGMALKEVGRLAAEAARRLLGESE